MQGFSVHTGVKFLHSPMAATKINKEGVSLDVPAVHASGPFKWPGGALMWPRGTSKKSSWKELIKPIEYSDVLVECEQ